MKQGYGRWGQTAQQDGECQSRLFQLDISNVETAHILVGALESPGDVLIHRAVIKIQALQGIKSKYQYPGSCGPCSQSTPEFPLQTSPLSLYTDPHCSTTPSSAHLIKIFIFIVIWHVHTKLLVLPPLL